MPAKIDFIELPSLSLFSRLHCIISNQLLSRRSSVKNVKTSAHSQKFMSLEMVSAQLLFCAALLALFLSNSPWKSHYHFFQTQLNLSFLINEGLMTIFFLVVGLEVKYELLQGSLNSFSKAALPAIGALGGMLVPAGIYVLFNEQDAFLLRAWAVPTA
ncbi:MAG TPA: Na+/H+ antiporter NhaA, partial [Gammaproteobacteria bacterium]|nr:Na+/H+ antiporter NhaA [Gammaproteobacteria bacterium]